jgi:hypothetical protein
VATVTARVHYVESVFFGRCGAAALRVLRRFASRLGGVACFTAEEMRALEWLAKYLPEARARTIQVFARSRPLVAFSDGACEEHLTSCGAVLLDGPECSEFFGVKVPDEICAKWVQGESRQVIGQAELWPVLLSLLTWSDKMAGRQVIFFLDQDAARQALVKAYSPSRPSAEIVAQVFVNVALLEVYPWFARVPTESNVADHASRLLFGRVREELPGARLRDAKLP